MKKALLNLSVSMVLTLTAFSSFAADTVKVGIAAEPYPPMSTLKPDGTWEGFEIDLLKMICEKSETDCEIVAIAWDGIIPALQSKKIDMIFTSMSATEERAKKVLFSASYYNSLPIIIGLPDQKWSIDKDTLAKKIIGVQVSTISGEYIKSKAKDFVDVREYNTQDEVNSDLLAGRIDFMIADGVAAMDFYKKNGDDLTLYGDVEWDPILGKGPAAAFRHEDTALEAKITTAIKALIVSKEYEELSMKHLGTNIAPKS